MQAGADTASVVRATPTFCGCGTNWDGAVRRWPRHADVPDHQCGDGGHEHPTQTPVRPYTWRKEKGELKGLTVVVCGDLKWPDRFTRWCSRWRAFGAHVVSFGRERHGVTAIYDRMRLEREYWLRPGAGRVRSD